MGGIGTPAAGQTETVNGGLVEKKSETKVPHKLGTKDKIKRFHLPKRKGKREREGGEGETTDVLVQDVTGMTIFQVKGLVSI